MRFVTFSSILALMVTSIVAQNNSTTTESTTTTTPTTTRDLEEIVPSGTYECDFSGDFSDGKKIKCTSIIFKSDCLISKASVTCKARKKRDISKNHFLVKRQSRRPLMYTCKVDKNGKFECNGPCSAFGCASCEGSFVKGICKTRNSCTLLPSGFLQCVGK